MTHNWSSWKDYQNSSWSQWSSYGPPLPSSWKQDEAHHDSNLAHGYPLFRTIQPTAWSRKKGIHGLDPLELPVHQLCRYGLQEFSLRPLIAGRFLGLVCTRSVAESVFTAQLLKSMRENAVDVDIIADYLYQTKLINNVDSIKKWPTSWVYCSVNSWSGHKAESFAATEDRRSSASTCTGKISWQPQVFLTNLKAIQFLRNNHLSVALVPRLVARLNERQELRRRRRSRSCPRCFRLKRHQHLRCQRLQKAPTERQSVFLTVMMMFRCFPFRKCCMLLLLRSNITNLEAFGGYYQKMVSDISDGDPATCDESHTDFEWFWCHKNRSSAGSSSMDMSLKMTPSTLHHFVAIGASLTAWLVCEARDHESMNVEVLFSVIDILRSALTHFVHYVPFISGGPAMWSLSILHVLLLTRYSAPTLTTRQCRNRWKNSSISPHMYTYPFFNPHMWSLSRCRFTHLTRSGGGTRSPDIFISAPLPFQQWNVSSTG